MAKMAKIMLATRSPVFCELMRAFLRSLCDLSVKISEPQENWSYVTTLPLRNAAVCTRMPRTASPINTIVDPDAGRVMAL